MKATATWGVARLGGDTPTQVEVESQACDAIASVREALEGVAGLHAESNVDQAQDARQTSDDALAGLRDAIGEIADGLGCS